MNSSTSDVSMACVEHVIRRRAPRCWYPYISPSTIRLSFRPVHGGIVGTSFVVDARTTSPSIVWRTRMLWVGIGIALVIAVTVGAVIVARRPADDLGSVSDHWISQHRADAP